MLAVLNTHHKHRTGVGVCGGGGVEAGEKIYVGNISPSPQVSLRIIYLSNLSRHLSVSGDNGLCSVC